MLLALQQTGGSAGGGLSILLFQVAAIALVFYFLILRPQGQARKKHAEVLAGLKRNDDVMTAGGIVGKVKDIKEVDTNGIKETRVTIESGILLMHSSTLHCTNNSVARTLYRNCSFPCSAHKRLLNCWI